MRAYLPDYDLRLPPSLADALDLMAQEPGVWQPFAGGTDLMVLLEAGKLRHRQFLSLWHLPELRGISVSGDRITLGALTTYTQIQRHAALQQEFPLLCRAASWTGGVAIQNRGTLGGNIANASPAADSLPALLAYEAELELVSANGARLVPYQDFHAGYKTTVRQAGEIIKSIHLPRGFRPWRQHTRKVGTRKAQAISKVSLAALARVTGGQVEEVRLAFGSVAPTPIRCFQTEAVLRGRRLDEEARLAAQAALAAEIAPIDDVRSTSAYRARVAANLLAEFLLTLKSD